MESRIQNCLDSIAWSETNDCKNIPSILFLASLSLLLVQKQLTNKQITKQPRSQGLTDRFTVGLLGDLAIEWQRSWR